MYTTLDAFAARIARVLIGGFFALSGANNLLDLSEASIQAAGAGVPAAPLFVLTAACFKILLGSLIIVKFHSKAAAMFLIWYVIISTLIFYNPSKWDDYSVAQSIFVRNIAILGGLLFLYAHSRGPALFQHGKVKTTP